MHLIDGTGSGSSITKLCPLGESVPWQQQQAQVQGHLAGATAATSGEGKLHHGSSSQGVLSP